MDDNSAKTLLQFQARKDIIYLYKRLLTVVEDIRDEHYFMLEKLEKALPKEYHDILNTANYMDNNKFALLRKRVLDAGNETVRQMDAQIDKFQINFD